MPAVVASSGKQMPAVVASSGKQMPAVVALSGTKMPAVVALCFMFNLGNNLEDDNDTITQNRPRTTFEQFEGY